MRTGCKVDNREVVALHLADEVLCSHLGYSASTIQAAIRDSDVGGNSESKDFVPPTSVDPIITRRRNGKRWSCSVIWLDKLPPELRQQLKEGT